MTELLRANRTLLFIFGTAALLLGLCVTVVPETSQAVVTRWGEPVRVVNRWRPGQEPGGGGGLLAHLPVIEQVTWVERGLASFSTARLAVRSADQQAIEVDTATTFRVFDPAKLVETAGSMDRAVEQLRGALAALAQQELGSAEAGRLLMPGSDGATARLRAALDGRARKLGVQIVDLRLTGAMLPEGELKQTFERMAAERTQIAASETREGQREAENIMAKAEADAARILGVAAGKDPAFYDFYRAMRSYERVFANPHNKGTSTIVLGPDSEYLKQFKGN